MEIGYDIDEMSFEKIFECKLRVNLIKLKLKVSVI
jgi:hypothetical protein